MADNMAPQAPHLAIPYRPATSAAELCKAASRGDVQAVQRMLDAGVPADAKDGGGWTPLHRAVQQGHEPVVRLLLSRGAAVSGPGPAGLHPLHTAVMVRDAALARVLLAGGAATEAAPTGLTPLLLAVSTGRADTLEALLEAGADARARVAGEAGRGETALHMAVAAWHGDLLPRLLAAGLDVDAAGLNPAGQTPLHIAAWYGYESAARALLDAGADVGARYADGETALHRAAQHGQLAMCELLLERGADMMATTPMGETALVVAAMHGKTRVVEMLLDRSSGMLTESQKARVLISAAGRDRVEVVHLLLEKGFDVNATHQTVSALDVACLYGQEKAIISLLEKGARAGIYGDRRISSREWAASSGHTSIVGLLDGTRPLPRRDQGDFVDTESLAWALSLDTTFQSRRRIMANPTPGGFPARCHVCQDLNFRRGVPKDSEVMHWILDSSVAQGASAGCPGCTMIRQCLQHLASINGESLPDWKTADKPCQLLSMIDGGPLYVTCGVGIGADRPSVSAEIYSHLGSPVNWPVVGVAREVTETPWSDQQRGVVRGLIEECTKTHESCSYKESLLPTRVIDVGSDTEEPRLHISQGEAGRYVTLSHCWGGSSPTTTTTPTLEQRTMGIPLASLPKTFRDAVQITRDLGVRYLWIDSLCILQDSREDWEKEAASMSVVYEGGYVMIAAGHSTDCHGGCLPPPPAGPAHRSFSMDVQGPGGRASKVYYRVTNPLNDDWGEICHRLYDPQGGYKRTALDSRGWTLQERILAPRTLHFGSFEMGWECGERRACECQAVPTQTDTDSRFKAQLVNFGARPAAAGGDTAGRKEGSAEEKRWLWSNIVEEFTHRQLTKTHDLLPALSGLARRMSQTAQSDYVCGMWRDKLAGFLAWRPDFAYIHQKAALAGLPRRHEGGYYAPSWSWASVIAPIRHRGGGPRPFEHGWKRPYPISKGESGWRDDDDLLKVLDFQGVPSWLNPFGPPKSASLTVRGYVAAAVFRNQEKDPPAHLSRNLGLLVGTVGGPDSAAQAHFEPDVCDEHAEVEVGDELCVLFMGESRTSDEGMRTLPNGKLEGMSRTASGHGLVLKVAPGTEGNYSRVGTFSYQGAAKWEAWRAARTEWTMRLV